MSKSLETRADSQLSLMVSCPSKERLDLGFNTLKIQAGQICFSRIGHKFISAESK